MKTRTVDNDEIAHFAKDSSHWWDPNGPFRPLHMLTPARMEYIRDTVCFHFGLDKNGPAPFQGLNILDIGCGGGLACEPAARLGAEVTGVDADENAIATARAHAQEQDLAIAYVAGAAEDLGSKSYDVVLALEVIEHVSDPVMFISLCSKLLKPGGVIIFSTLNRTWKSYALGIVAVEYILHWAARGTHEWKKFIRPAELARQARQQGLSIIDVCGLVFDPLHNDFKLKKHDTDINYFLTAKK